MRIMFSVVAGALLAGLILAIIGAINAGSIESKTPSTFYVSLENVYPHHTSTVKLPVYNPGNEPANVETWETSCSCSMPKSAPKTVPPKATVAYTVTLDTWAMHERFKRGGKVALVPILETNGGKSCRSPPVELRFTFREAFERSPDRLVFLRRNTPKRITLRSRIPGGQFAIVSSPDWLKSEISPTQENDVWVLTCTAETLKSKATKAKVTLDLKSQDGSSQARGDILVHLLQTEARGFVRAFRSVKRGNSKGARFRASLRFCGESH